MTVLEHALQYLEKYKFSVIPLRQDKRPKVKWEEFQHRRPTVEEVTAWWTETPDAMIGIVTGEVSDLFVVDIDTKQGMENISSFIPETLITPTVKSPRGGQHLYFKNPDVKLTIGAGVIPGTDFRGNGGYIVAPPSKNSTGGAYQWMDGLSPEDVPLVAVPAPYLLFILNNSIRFIRSQENEKILDTQMFVKGRRDNDLFHVANTLVKARMPEYEIKQVLEKLALLCNPPFPLNEIPAKIQSAIGRSERANVNLTDEIRAWISVTSGNFSVRECIKSLQSETGVTKRNMGNVRVIFKRLRDEGYIERVTNLDGWYRRVECDDLRETNWKDTEEKTINIAWPFEIEKLVHIKPKNIVIVAGSPDAGKTAFLLNLIEKNMGSHKINYFSSEMGADELKGRIKKFGFPLSYWNFKFFEKGSNFGDATAKFPNDINIFDFLETTGAEGSEFYKVAAFIKDIFDRLNDGVAVIAIQKNFNADLGRGGLGTLEKARLYVSIEKGVIKIVKAKNWVDSERNPNGLSLEFRIVNGCKLIQDSDWSVPYDDVREGKREGYKRNSTSN